MGHCSIVSAWKVFVCRHPSCACYETLFLTTLFSSLLEIVLCVCMKNSSSDEKEHDFGWRDYDILSRHKIRPWATRKKVNFCSMVWIFSQILSPEQWSKIDFFNLRVFWAFPLFFIIKMRKIRHGPLVFFDMHLHAMEQCPIACVWKKTLVAP